jgi:hypothetical protein
MPVQRNGGKEDAGENGLEDQHELEIRLQEVSAKAAFKKFMPVGNGNRIEAKRMREKTACTIY